MGRKRKLEVNSYLNESSNSNSQTHLNVLQRSAANDRERTRMRVLSKAFVRLKTSLPWVPSDTKLSKLDTLKLATSYISYLTKILEDDDLNVATDESDCNINCDHIYDNQPVFSSTINIKSNPDSNKIKKQSNHVNNQNISLALISNSSNGQTSFVGYFF
jgi:hypothetical protein